ncbi:transcription factor FAR1 [Elysia marginata]|uniref:Transcription factor FAR1 n=1 Tax=Elysia marginata TaxID=1093978 RepID=A0AAV4J412_9GAST|nr:transcription factor FAR1 [Elysia marginata]
MATAQVESTKPTSTITSPLCVGETFNSYAEAELRIHQWGEQNNTLFIKTDGKRVKHEDLQKTVGYEYISYACKQGGPPRVGSGRGIRVNQRTVKTNCPVKLRLVHEIIDGEHRLVIKTLVLNHNHEISEEIYKGYPENRRANVTPELVELLNTPEVSNTVVRDFIKREQGVHMLPRDVNNLRKRVHMEAFPKSEETEVRVINIYSSIRLNAQQLGGSNSV